MLQRDGQVNPNTQWHYVLRKSSGNWHHKRSLHDQNIVSRLLQCTVSTKAMLVLLAGTARDALLQNTTRGHVRYAGNYVYT